MAAERQTPGLMTIISALLVSAILFCLPEAWAAKLRGLVHDGLSPGQCVVAATLPQAVHPAQGAADVGRGDTAWQRETRYWQAEVARLNAELEELKRVPTWPEAVVSSPLVRPVLRSARVIGWERAGGTDGPVAVLRAGKLGSVEVGDLVLAPGESLLDQGQSRSISPDNLVLAGRSVIGRISQTSRWTSTIQPVTAREFRGQAQIVRLHDGEALLGAEGILAGGPDGKCQLLHVGETEPVAEGDLVFTSLRGVPLSPPLYYGTVTKAELQSSEPDWTIEVAPHFQGVPPAEVLVLELSVEGAAAPPAPSQGAR